MVALGISEFTFGYAFLFEQTVNNWSGLKAAPILPSLYDESRKGWDAKLPLEGAAYYYQFKLTEYLSRRNAAYISSGIYNAPYYRIALHKRDANRQHRRLKALAKEFPDTYYVAPEILNIEEFNRLFMDRQITDGSRLIPVNKCKDINDSEQHYITFQQGIQSWNEHSENEFHRHSILGRDIAELYRESEFHSIDDEYIKEIFVKLRNIVIEISFSVQTRHIEGDDSIDELMNYDLFQNMPEIRSAAQTRRIEDDNYIDELMNYDPTNHPHHEVFDHISYILSTFFGTTMVIVGKDE